MPCISVISGISSRFLFKKFQINQKSTKIVQIYFTQCMDNVRNFLLLITITLFIYFKI